MLAVVSRAHIKKGRALGRLFDAIPSRPAAGALIASLLLCLLDPPAQQPPDLGHHIAHVLVLAGRYPAPAQNQAQVEAQRVQVGIGILQVAQAGLVGMRVGLENCFLEVQRSPGQAGGQDEALIFGEFLGTWQKPGQQVEGARKDDHCFGHG